jgi:Domain of unknown function (DUF397)
VTYSFFANFVDTPPPPPWKKSSFSNGNGGNNCVEVAPGPGGQMFVRDSKHPDGRFLKFTGEEWKAFLDGVKAGEFDLPG